MTIQKFVSHTDLITFHSVFHQRQKKNDYEKVCEEECCEEDSIDSNSINSLNLYSNRAEILLNVINYSLKHMTFTADDLGELSGIQEELMKYTKEDK